MSSRRQSAEKGFRGGRILRDVPGFFKRREDPRRSAELASHDLPGSV